MNRSNYIKNRLFELESKAWDSYNRLLEAEAAILDLMQEVQKLKNISV